MSHPLAATKTAFFHAKTYPVTRDIPAGNEIASRNVLCDGRHVVHIPLTPDIRQNKTIPMHTIEKISTITLAQVTARLLAANERVKEAADDIVERYHKRGPEPVCPSDLTPLPAPTLPTISTTAGIATNYTDWTMIGYSHFGVGAGINAHPESDAKTLVAAIEAVDALAATMERLASEYRDATAAAIAAHASEQAEATRTLVGLVASA